MELDCDSVSYSASEFLNKFSNKLPQIVMVTQGFCGEISVDTFDVGQVVRIHTYSKQSRVVAQQIEPNSQLRGRHYSIPLDYPTKFSLAKSRASKQYTLKELVESNSLPVEVNFIKDQTVTVGPRTLPTNNLPGLRIIATFEETYLLGNSLVEGMLDPRTIPVPLYLSDLKLAVVTGIKGKPESVWQRYLEELSDQATALVYDTHYGNKDIAVYHSDSIHPNSVYAEVAPREYTNFVYAFMDVNSLEPEGKFYNFVNSESGTRSNLKQSPNPARKSQTPDDQDQIKNHPKSRPNTQEGKSTAPDTNLKSSPRVTENISNNEIKVGVATLKADNKDSPKEKRKVIDTDTQTEPVTSRSVVAETQTEPVTSKNTSHLENMSISDLEKLLEKLKLEKYKTLFHENMIDGALLMEFDSGLLREEFGFTKVEAIRLMKFVKDGHIPK
ncbi:hypothetical protein CHS0354_017612 [Potamilus streckersoni]|uniref:SAM domain-containing protein n=1 Tax=Potamilus streckersoni TaxID=2493646 RepID=A0AAE0RNY3_9BIVA|nr:hypothetical protein CHS0354_017612 [Potamilus streckersoni]